MAAEGPRSATDGLAGGGVDDEASPVGADTSKDGGGSGRADRTGEPEAPMGGRPRPQPWGPFVLLSAVGAGLLWISWRTDLGRLDHPTAIGGAALVGIVLVLTVNRLRKGGRPAPRR